MQPYVAYEDKTKKPGCLRRGLKWGAVGFVGLIAFTLIGQGLGFIPTAEEMRMTETAEAVVVPSPTRTVTAEAVVAQAVETEEITPTAEGATDTPTVTHTPTHTATIIPTATYQGQQAARATAGRVLDGAFDTVDVVSEVGISTAFEADGGWTVYLEAVVQRGSVTEGTADLIRQAAYARLGSARVEISMILDDGDVAAAYTWDNDDDEWRVTELESAGQPIETPTPTRTAGSTNTPAPRLGAQASQYTTGSANVRSCPDTSCGIVTTLTGGAAITTYGSTNGQTVSGSDDWWMIRIDGEIVYVHSSLVTSVQPIAPATSAPAQQWSCSGDIYNCADLTCAQIRDYLRACPNDPSDLDHDGNGRACESKCY